MLLQYFFHKNISFRTLPHSIKTTSHFREVSVFVPRDKNCIFKHSSSALWDLHFLIYAAGTCDTVINLNQQLGRKRATWRNYFRGKQPAWSGSMPVGLSTSLMREQEISKCIFQLSLKGSFGQIQLICLVASDSAPE